MFYGEFDAVCGANDVQTTYDRRTNGVVSEMIVARLLLKTRGQRQEIPDLIVKERNGDKTGVPSPDMIIS